MTGYTKQYFKIQDTTLSILIKSLNSSKGLDVSIKIPRYLLVLENEIKKLIEKELIRGKVSFLIMDNNHSSSLILNKKKLLSHIKSIKNITPDAGEGFILNAAIKLPDIFSNQEFQINKKVKKEILTNTIKALKVLNKCRNKEGEALMKEIKTYINSIIKTSKQLVLLEKKRLKNRKSKIYNQIKKESINYNPSRLESEMIYYFERNDITEERVRLQHHCVFFLEVMKNENVMGKKLIFISQEILREINTIGSKANDFEIQKRVVNMKEQIEKAKEQLQNIL